MLYLHTLHCSGSKVAVGGLTKAAGLAFAPIGPLIQYFSFYCACQGFLSLGGHCFPAKQCLRLHRFLSVLSSILSPTLGMASRRARQRLKGGGGSGGDAGPATEKLGELPGSREAGAEPRPECVCGRRAWRAAPGSPREPELYVHPGVGSPPWLCFRATRRVFSCPSWERPGSRRSSPSADPCIFAARVCHASGSSPQEQVSRW